MIFVLLVFVILIWGITFVNTRALLVDFSALEIQLIRFALAWVVLKVLSWRARPHFIKYGLRDEGVFALMGLTGVFLYQFLENCAIYYTNASNVAIFVSFGPVVTALLSRIFTNDRSISASLLYGSLIAIGGVTLVSLNGVVNLHLRPLGDLMAIGAMLAWGVYSILIAKVNGRGFPPEFVIRRVFGWALVFMLPLAIWGLTDAGYTALDGSFSITLDSEVNRLRFTEPMNWVNLGFLGVCASAICFVLWNVVCKAFGVVKTTIGLYLTPVAGVVFAMMFLGERPAPMSIVGGAVIILGVVMANWRRRS